VKAAHLRRSDSAGNLRLFDRLAIGLDGLRSDAIKQLRRLSGARMRRRDGSL